MKESKIDITERLRRENRWKEASKAKDEKIKELRNSGISKREASEKAWEWLESEYTPLTDDEINWRETVEILTMAEFPVTWGDTEDGTSPKLNSFWWPFCHLRACWCRWDTDFVDAWWMVHRMVIYAPNATTRSRSIDCILKPLKFLDDMKAKMERMLSPLLEKEELTDIQKNDIQLLEWWISEIPDFKEFLVDQKVVDEGQTLLGFWSFEAKFIDFYEEHHSPPKLRQARKTKSKIA